MRSLNLYIPLTDLVGRDQDMTAIKQLLQQPKARLVTLVGPPGVGKTHLALQVARELESTFADGAFFVPLAPVSDQGLVLATIAQHLKLPPSPDTLTEYLAGKQILLVLDNFEQVVAAADSLVGLMVSCPDVKLLVTSRESLRVRGEYEFPVPPLPQEWAVNLFVQRVQAIQPEFRLEPDLAETIAEICRRLDGLPLAIELSAARIKLFPPPVLLKRLEDQLQVLTNGPRDLPHRHQTLRAAVQWSYDLLPPGEQRLFRRLGVFAGGCTLEAANHVAPLEVESGIESLINKNLLQQGSPIDGEMRISMLQTIREYALEQLAMSGEYETVQRAHAQYFRGLAEYAEYQLIGTEVTFWLERLEREHNNIRAALKWGLDSEDSDLVQRLSGSLWRFWFLRGHLTEGRKWLEAALTMSSEIDPVIEVKVLSAAGYLAATQSDFTRAEFLCEKALQISHQTNDEKSMALALFGLANTANWGRNYIRARSLFEASLELYRKLDDHWGIASTLAYLGSVLFFQGEYEEARVLLDQALVFFRKLHQDWGMAFSLYSSGLVAINQKDLKQAQRQLEESQTLLRRLGDKRGLVRTSAGLAKIALEQNRFPEARALILNAMSLTREVGDSWSATVIVDLMGSLVLRCNKVELAVQLFGAAEALRDAISVPLSPAFRDWRQNDYLAARAKLSQENLMQLWVDGSIYSLEKAIELFKQVKLQLEHPPNELTLREIDVLRLVGKGLSDAEIAEDLILSVRTVNAHLRSIYRKLGVTSRTAATRWALENGYVLSD